MPPTPVNGPDPETVTPRVVMTVTGPVPAGRLGATLPHEHVMCDFGGAAVTGPHRWDVATVAAAMEPLLADVRDRGVATFVDCTPAYIGREPRLLEQLSAATGVNIITNTGYYGGADDAFVPRHAYVESEARLAQRWLAEVADGIDGTGIRPGFIKTGVDEISGSLLSAIDDKLVRAAALTSTRTGLAVTCHTGGAAAGLAATRTFIDAGGDPARFVVAHSDGHGTKTNRQVAELGAWVSFDGVGRRDLQQHLTTVLAMLDHRPDRVLLSQDSGWWNAGTDDGGEIADYVALFDVFLPALRDAGVGEDMVRALTVTNPAVMLAGLGDPAEVVR